MLPENNEEDKSFQSRKLNLEAKYESLLIVPQDPTEKSCAPPCNNCVCNSESENNEQLEEKEEEKEQLKENKNTNLEESKIDKELKNQKECIIV